MVSVSTTSPLSPNVLFPRCTLCGADFEHLTRFFTRVGNRNGNSGRPYIKCMPCNKFVTFLDGHGIEDHGPRCSCDLPCRRQVSGRYAKTKPRGLHYVCSIGFCNYYEPQMNEEGEQQTLDENVIDLFAALKFI